MTSSHDILIRQLSVIQVQLVEQTLFRTMSQVLLSCRGCFKRLWLHPPAGTHSRAHTVAASGQLANAYPKFSTQCVASHTVTVVEVSNGSEQKDKNIKPPKVKHTVFIISVWQHPRHVVIVGGSRVCEYIIMWNIFLPIRSIINIARKYLHASQHTLSSNQSKA